MRRVYAGRYAPEQRQGTKRIPEQQVGYQLKVFSYIDLFWHPRREQIVPGGMLREIFHADVGELVSNFVFSFAPPDGFSYVDGKARFPSKKSPREKDFLLPAELREIEQYARLVLVARKHEFIYNLKLAKDAISIERPLEYLITQYSSIDSKMKEKETERVVPWFKKKNGENLPHPDKFSLVVNPRISNLSQN